ncbi:latrophilin Cirl [Trichonephila clavipes]|uniref:Latrophilin Cirl n=1 Tax=Trichonephila clavipes TaxID=2585209 RepID=A0A8X6SCJ4_TRICX|nr:latrophilin Cirl [Trichonephila clavipes]
MEQSSENVTRIINSRIIGASLDKSGSIKLRRPAIITLKHLVEANITNPVCVFWDFHLSALLVEWLRQQTKLPHLSEANPQVYVETPLHPEKLTVWCALWAGGIIGPYFFKNDEGHNVTVNGDRYRAMITNFFIPELNNHDV